MVVSPSRPAAGAWRPSDADVKAIAAGRHPDPFAVLGRHGGPGDMVSVRVFAPTADRVEVIGAAGGVIAELERVHTDGFFAGPVADGEQANEYRLRYHRNGYSWEAEDAYRFPPILGDIDVHLFAEGSHQRIYEKLGAHPGRMDGVEGTFFAVWAPNATRVSVVGSFNEWDGRRHPMRKRADIGVFELFIPGVAVNTLYKFELLGPNGNLLPLKADPISFCQEKPPATGSIVHGLVRRDLDDGGWMSYRQAAQSRSAPISIYEIHLGSWRRGEDNRYLDYDEIADQLIPYVLDLGFTHVELLPISEHPFSGSWGYQPIGLFAPTSRFGTPEMFARFVSRCHSAGVGVIIDWVPAHFPTDEHGLARFDGTALYEHEDPRLGRHQDWDTLIYNFGRNEVANFLESNALYWLEQFHIDGLRVDAVASMLYRDYSRKPGEWLPNIHGGNENLEAIGFLRGVNRRIASNHPGAMTIAEESTSWPMVSGRVEVGGLGFDFKWNMGWMHDTLDYMRRDPIHRRYHHNQLTFGLLYAFSENFVLPLSHDEVVHGKGSLLGKMPGDRWRRFANLRAYLAFMWMHPGKKLLFMGGEFAQEREWNHDRALDWNALQDELHRGVQVLVRDLNRLYRGTPALHEKDCESAGFEWIDASDTEQCVLCFLRRGAAATSPVLVVCNFTPEVRRGYRVGVPEGGRWIERLNSDAALYGGSNVGNSGECEAEEMPFHGRSHSLRLSLPPLATIVFERAGM